jgi:hypothetical protein
MRRSIVLALLFAGCDSTSGGRADGQSMPDASGPATTPTPDAPAPPPPDAGPSSPLLPVGEVTLCRWRGQEDTWIAESGEAWIRYSCREPCVGSWVSCAAPTPFVDAHGGAPKLELPFVADEMAGRLRLSDRPGPTLAVHTGGPGNSYLSEGSLLTQASSELVAALETHAPQHFRVIEVRWESGLNGQGYATPSSAGPRSLRLAIRRPASLLHFIKTTLLPTEKLGTVGCSGGTIQSLGAALWYQGIDEDVAYQLAASGPPNWNVNTWCGGTPAPEGRCENDPTISCTDDGPCGDARNRCAYEIASDSLLGQTLRLVVDLQHGTSDCAGKRYRVDFDADSFALTPARLALAHRVDLIVSEGCSLAEGCTPSLFGVDDTSEGITAQMARLFLAMSSAGADVGWTDLHGTAHCDAIVLAELVPGAVALIVAGME